MVVVCRNTITLWKISTTEQKIIYKSELKELHSGQKKIYRGAKFDPSNTEEIILFVGKMVPGVRSWIEQWQVSTSPEHQVSPVQSTIAHRSQHHNTLAIR